jgi:hypothetical protein
MPEAAAMTPGSLAPTPGKQAPVLSLPADLDPPWLQQLLWLLVA